MQLHCQQVERHKLCCVSFCRRWHDFADRGRDVGYGGIHPAGTLSENDQQYRGSQGKGSICYGSHLSVPFLPLRYPHHSTVTDFARFLGLSTSQGNYSYQNPYQNNWQNQRYYGNDFSRGGENGYNNYPNQNYGNVPQGNPYAYLFFLLYLGDIVCLPFTPRR